MREGCNKLIAKIRGNKMAIEIETLIQSWRGYFEKDKITDGSTSYRVCDCGRLQQ
jgi:hypothetical protein